MRRLVLLHSCFRTNRSVGRRGEKLWVHMQQVQRANRHHGLSEAVRNRRTAVALC